MVSDQDTAVVILSYNGKKWHDLFLPLILSESPGQYNVYVVDNASTDDTADHVRRHFPEVNLLQLPENHGFSYGYAKALESISAKYYLLLSADFEVSPGWFSPLKEAMDKDPRLAACQPKIKYWRDRSQFEYAGAAGGYMDRLGYLFCRGRLFHALEEDQGQYDDNKEVFWASGGCFMVRSSAYHQVGGLDPDLYAHMEEIDLCWRLKNAGYRIGYIGDSTVFHVGGSVISYGSPQKLYYNFRNNLILLLKNARGSTLCWLFPFRLVLDGVAGLRFLLTGQWKEALTIIKAHFHVYSRFGHWWRQRRKVSKLRQNPNQEGVYPRSIVWDFFIRGRRRFSDLRWESADL